MWQEKRKKPIADKSDMAELSFSVDCRELPYDHAYELSSEILKLVPEIKNDKRNAIQTLHGPMSGNGWVRPDSENIPLSKRAKLIMRINKNQLNDIKNIEGKEIKLFGNTLKIGRSKVKNFLVVKDLFCRFVMSDHETSEDEFLNKIQNELKGLNINIRKALCGRSMVISFDRYIIFKY